MLFLHTILFCQTTGRENHRLLCAANNLKSKFLEKMEKRQVFIKYDFIHQTLQVNKMLIMLIIYQQSSVTLAWMTVALLLLYWLWLNSALTTLFVVFLDLWSKRQVCKKTSCPAYQQQRFRRKGYDQERGGERWREHGMAVKSAGLSSCQVQQSLWTGAKKNCYFKAHLMK